MSVNLSRYDRRDEANVEYHADASRKTDGISPDKPKFSVPLTAQARSAHQDKVTRIIEKLLAEKEAQGK